jgi:peptide/nickel transport system ATP-binding protein
MLEPTEGDAMTQAPLVHVENLSVRFPVGQTGLFRDNRKLVHAVENVSFDIAPGETLGLVGESGSGKSTTGRAILGSAPMASGKVVFDGKEISSSSKSEIREMRRQMQLVFQDPYSSLNPRMTVGEIVAEPLVVHGLAKSTESARDAVVAILEQCGMPADSIDRFPYAFSGGQRQRVGIARALALRPKFIIADEPVSALDVSVRAQIVNLLKDLQIEMGVSYLFIAHDLSVVRHVSHKIGIMYSGSLVEYAPVDAVYTRPIHPYTEALLSSVPVPDPVIQRSRIRIPLTGEIPNPMSPPSGCRFHTRCPLAEARCRVETPQLEEKSPGHFSACFIKS